MTSPIGQSHRWATGEPQKPLSPSMGMALLILRIIVGGVLIYSGFSKAVAPSAEFAAALAAYKILPVAIIPWIALIWPWVELLVGTYVLFGYFTQVFAGVSAGMFVIFLIVLGSATMRGIDPGSCGCFGLGVTMSPHKMLAIDTILLALSVILTPLSNKLAPYSADSWINR